ncbi:FtsJ-like methyltransferase-domain-containing protein [Irpex rosettiformis]|uniref:FtsJ-like methyltransferase-domain-containing protein n=1 Tax=Irpex rosettiformis TaxID=378272 RepID=A0ACB8TPG5_9APHY|nr:FtsJ-like methyltransferase-domain-containing protein [Irpex rosettiformis]
MSFRPTTPLFKKTSKSSTLWLARQYKDPYVKARLSNPVNYRSRSAFKLLELESRFKFLNDFLKEAKRSVAGSNNTKSKRVAQRTFNVVDLGAAPGGWSQVIAAKLGLAGEELHDHEPTRRRPPKRTSNMAEWKDEISKRKRMSGIDWSTPPSLKFDEMDPLDYLNSRDLERKPDSAEQGPPLPINLVALDILPMYPLVGVHSVQMNFLSPDAPEAVTSLLAQLNETRTGKVDLMLSDLSPPHTGNRTADVSHSITLLRAVWDFARKTLKTRYEYHLERVRQAQMKHFAHPLSTSFFRVFLYPYFSKVHYFKPPASRSDSTEGYWVCIGWRGVPDRITMEMLEEKMQKEVEAEKVREVEWKKDAAAVEELFWEGEQRKELDKDVKTAMGDKTPSSSLEDVLQLEEILEDKKS